MLKCSTVRPLEETEPAGIRISYPVWPDNAKHLSQRGCSLLEQIELRRCSFERYKELAEFHYRSGNHPAIVTDVFGAFLRQGQNGKAERVVGVIVYARPALHLAPRNRATRRRYVPGRNAAAAYRRLNREIKTISRVVLDPQFRGIGLAVRLVAETMPQVGALYIESLAAMGRVNPFFQKAGMTRWPGRASEDAARFIGVLRSLGIGREVIPDSARLEKAIDDLPEDQRRLVVAEMYRALDHYQRAWTSRKIKRDWARDLKRVSANMLNKADYFIWRNPNWQDLQKS